MCRSEDVAPTLPLHASYLLNVDFNLSASRRSRTTLQLPSMSTSTLFTPMKPTKADLSRKCFLLNLLCIIHI
jgi:hypothetical protein